MLRVWLSGYKVPFQSLSNQQSPSIGPHNRDDKGIPRVSNSSHLPRACASMLKFCLVHVQSILPSTFPFYPKPFRRLILYLLRDEIAVVKQGMAFVYVKRLCQLDEIIYCTCMLNRSKSLIRGIALLQSIIYGGTIMRIGTPRD